MVVGVDLSHQHAVIEPFSCRYCGATSLCVCGCL